MKEDNKKSIVQTRREFFRNAAKGVMPIVGILGLGQAFLSSCGRDDEPTESSSGGCKTCRTTCDAHCMSTCRFLAISKPSYSICKGTCKGDCYSTCKSTCMSGSKGGK